MMRCEETRNLLAAYLDGETTQSEKESMEAHLAACPACREELEKLGEAQAKFKQTLKMAAGNVSPSGRAWAKVRQQITQEQEKAAARVLPHESFWQRTIGKRLTWKTATAGVLAVVLIVSAAIAIPILTGHSEKLSAAEIALADPAVQAALGGVEPEGIGVTENINGTDTVRVVLKKALNKVVVADVDIKTGNVINVYVQEYSDATQQQAMEIAKSDPRVQARINDGYDLYLYGVSNIDPARLAEFTPEEEQLLKEWGVDIEDLIGIWVTMALERQTDDYIDPIFVWVNVSTERVVAYVEHPFEALSAITVTSTSTPVTIVGPDPYGSTPDTVTVNPVTTIVVTAK
jgi:hypothetical protein